MSFLSYIFDKERRKKRLFDNGWDWAAGELLRGIAPEKLDEQIVAGADFDANEFDKGANAALAKWNRKSRETQQQVVTPITSRQLEYDELKISYDNGVVTLAFTYKGEPCGTPVLLVLGDTLTITKTKRVRILAEYTHCKEMTNEP